MKEGLFNFPAMCSRCVSQSHGAGTACETPPYEIDETQP
jgi:hypothetical protein